MLKFKTFEHQTDITFNDIETIEGDVRLYKTPVGDFPSMTSVLSVLKDESNGLEKWRERVGDEEADRITNEAATRGTSLHDLSERYLKNELTRDQLVGPGSILFNRIKKYLDQVQLVIATEAALYNENLKYAGRTDAIVMMNDVVTIVDHKNSRKPINEKFLFGRQKLFKYKIQVAGYALAFEQMTGIECNHGCLFVGNHLTSNANIFTFDLDCYKKEVELVVKAYYNNANIKDSMFYRL